MKDISGKDITDITRPLATPNAVTGPIWTDRGSGANTDFGFWTLVCPDGEFKSEQITRCCVSNNDHKHFCFK